MSAPFYAEVVGVTRLSPHFVRITFGGAAMPDFVPVGHDQWFRLFLPHPGEDKPNLPDFTDDTGLRTWYNSTPESQRPIIRNYTVRRFHPETSTMDVDFVVHGDTGPATSWAQRVEIGDIVGLYDEGTMFTVRPDTAWLLFVGDETGLPAIAAVTETLSGSVPFRSFLEIPLAADRQELPGDGIAHWRYRETPGDQPELLDLLRDTDFPPGRVQALLVGESSLVCGARRHLVRDRGVDKDRIKFCGYWRHPATPDEDVD